MEHHAYLEFRKKYLRPLEKRENAFNDRLAITITRIVGTMWCGYAFAGLALVSLPAAIKGGTATLIAWIAQTFLQLEMPRGHRAGRRRLSRPRGADRLLVRRRRRAARAQQHRCDDP